MIGTVVFDVGETLVDETRMWSLWADWLEVRPHVLFAALGSLIERGEHHRNVFEMLRPGADPARSGVVDDLEAGDLYPDAAPCLRELDRRGLRVGIAANQSESTARIFENLPVAFVASSARWQVHKPSPLFFCKLVEEAQAPADTIAYVGDRLDNDVLPALEAGMMAIFLRRGPWGYLHALRPEAARAHLRIEGLAELPDALLNASWRR